jgi:predicted nucleotidyltransferase component of viral defense system
MIPQLNITAWSAQAPWPEPRQVEQDLIIARALVAIFSDPLLAQALRFRGGTALNKLHFPAPLRYSEDIDLVRTEHSPIGPIVDRLREVLEPWLGEGSFSQSAMAPKLRFKAAADDGGEIRLKVEINTHETEAHDTPIFAPLTVENPWFSGQAEIATFSRAEMLATKLRALLQRNKGRDLFDLGHALRVFPDLDLDRVVRLFGLYTADHAISRAIAEKRMLEKLGRPAFMQDMRPLLPAETARALTDAAIRETFTAVFRAFVWRLPGAAWETTPKWAERFGVAAVAQPGA